MEREKQSTVLDSLLSTPMAFNNGGTHTQPAAAPSPMCTSMDPANASSFPATFIHADAASFKRVVQMLTSSAAKRAAAPPRAGPKRPAFKLYERRRSNLSSLKVIGPLTPILLASSSSPFSAPCKRQLAEISSLSPVTPLIPDPFNQRRTPKSSTAAAASVSAEDRAIAEKGFYLHPSPGAAEEPRLLPLFPVASAKMSSAT